MNAMKKLSKMLGKRQREIAEACGYHPQYISNLATGRMPITPQFVARIQESYGNEAAALFLPYMGNTLPNPAQSLAAK